jgi:hypothetical protein
LAGNPSIRPHNRFASCETNAVHALENCQRDPAFICGEHKRIAGHIEPRQDFLRYRPRSNALLKIALFCGLQRVDGGISALSLEIRIVRRKSKKSAEFSNCPQIFWISSGVGFGRRERFRYQKNGDRTDSLERRSKLIDHDRFGRAPVGITEHAESLHLKPVHREMLKSFFDVSRLDRSHPRTAERHPD